MEQVKDFFETYPVWYRLLQITGVIVFAYIVYLIFKKTLIFGVKKIVKRTRTNIDDILLNDVILKRIALIAPILVISQFLYLIPQIENVLKKFTDSVIVLIFLMIIGSLLNAANEIYEQTRSSERKPIKSYLQIAKIVVYVLGGIAIVGLLTGQQPWKVVTGVGAFTALLILIFKDTILSFIASIHISAYDLIRVGDWIEVPQYNVDGDVLDVALHTIKVQNFDKTIVVFPTSKILENSFKNWRGMQKAGSRRIKRAIYIDISSIKFCTEDMLNKFKKIHLIKNYLEEKEKEIEKYNQENKVDTSNFVNGRRITNIGTFREYLKSYLKSREDINQDFTFIVRQLAPGENGIPIEIYVFAKTTNWVEYEGIQSDIFDHIFAIVSEFDLCIFQKPTGKDFKKLNKAY